MINKKTWQEFQDTGLIWWINRILHTFGWVIVYVVEVDGTISDVYPARASYRGFAPETETRGFKKVSAYMQANAAELEKEVNE